MDAGKMAASNIVDVTSASELVLSKRGSSTVQILGNRAFQHIYRQRTRPPPSRAVAANHMALSYRSFGALDIPKEEIVRRAQRRQHERRRNWSQMKSEMANDKIFNLPKNVTY
jgi:hypothetical protein